MRTTTLCLVLLVAAGCSRDEPATGDWSFGSEKIDGRGSTTYEPSVYEQIDRHGRWTDKEKRIMKKVVGWFD